MILICQATTQDPGHDARAQLEMRPGLARRLLAYWPLWQQVEAHDSDLYCLEFFDQEVDYSEFADGPEPPNEGSWFSIESTPDELQRVRTSAETVRVTREGVFWSAFPRDTAEEFQTAAITWEQLEAVARGENPFPFLLSQEEEPC